MYRKKLEDQELGRVVERRSHQGNKMPSSKDEVVESHLFVNGREWYNGNEVKEKAHERMYRKKLENLDIEHRRVAERRSHQGKKTVPKGAGSHLFVHDDDEMADRRGRVGQSSPTKRMWPEKHKLAMEQGGLSTSPPAMTYMSNSSNLKSTAKYDIERQLGISYDGIDRAPQPSYPGRVHLAPEPVYPGAVAMPGVGDYETRDSFAAPPMVEDQSGSNEPISAEVVDAEEEARRMQECVKKEVQQSLERERAEREKNTAVAEVVSDPANDNRCGSRMRWLAVFGVLLVVAAIVLGIMLPRALDEDPTPPPDTSEEPPQDLADLLSSVSPDGGVALRTPSTPQYDALSWLAENANVDAYTDAVKIQRYALATFFYSAHGDDWTNNAGWLTETDECSWYTYANDDDATQFCSPGGEIVELVLWNNTLKGTIPEEMALLSTRLGE